ncbi:MAG: hypothetical protein AAF567_23515 [Actinomycetota bacterium]
MAEPKVRRSREELRKLMLDAGRDVLADIRPTLGCDQLNYARVFSHLEETQGIRVTHASVHERIWPNVEAYRLDVLETSLQGASRDARNELRPVLQATLDGSDLTTVAGRKQAFTDLLRVPQNAYWELVMLRDQPWRASYQMLLHLSLRPAGHDGLEVEYPGLLDLVGRLRTESFQRHCDNVQLLADLIGARPRPELGDPAEAVRRIAHISHVAALGFVVGAWRDPGERWKLPTGPDGEEQEWYPVSHAVWNHLRGAFELADTGLTAEERRL